MPSKTPRQRRFIFAIRRKYYLIKDVGSGLSDTRNGFVKTTNLVISKKISKINDIGEQEDLATDLVHIIASFSVRLYGNLSA